MNAAPELHRQQEIMIIAGEASGDLHGAHLVQALRKKNPYLRFSGIGGEKMLKAGVELLYDAGKIAVMGVDIFGALGDIYTARKMLLQRLKAQRPDLLILIDYPGFNLRLARVAKKMGIRIFYYISPQLWAWHSSRIKVIKQCVDRMVVILPFEKEFYAREKYQVDFVGHPLIDTVQPQSDGLLFLKKHKIDPSKKRIGLLPGSRTKEIAKLLPDFLGAAELLLEKNPQDYVFLIPQASTIDRRTLDAHGLADWEDKVDFRVIEEDHYSMMAVCDAAVAASGTVTLELAILGTPTVAAYRMAPLSYYLARKFVRNIKYFTLVNLIGDQKIIPELLQDQVQPQRIANELETLLHDKTRLREMQIGLREVRELIGPPGATERIAALVLQELSPEPNYAI